MEGTSPLPGHQDPYPRQPELCDGSMHSTGAALGTSQPSELTVPQGEQLPWKWTKDGKTLQSGGLGPGETARPVGRAPLWECGGPRTQPGANELDVRPR